MCIQLGVLERFEESESLDVVHVQVRQQQINAAQVRAQTTPEAPDPRPSIEHEQGAVLHFLEDPELQATNWRAEQAIRPAVVMRKICGGNRTERGAFTHETLVSIIVSARKLKLDPLPLLAELPRAPSGTIIPAIQQRLATLRVSPDLARVSP